jgi:hypothetical protein
MPTVKTKLDEASYARLVTLRRREGLPSVSALFLYKCGVLTDQMEAGEIVRRALRMAKQKPSGTRFRLRDLFVTRDWEAFSKGARLRAGKMFYDEIGSAVHGVRAERKSSANHQLYVTA